MRGADALVRALVAGDVGTIFALSGNQIMPVFDAVLDSDIRLIHARHEAATVFMAEAFAQLTSGVGVALVTAGGGLGNATGALIAARASDTAVLLLSGDSPVSGDGRAAFQEMDQCAMTRGVTKASRRVLRADDMAETVAWAIDLARSGRPGPVHLALPADVLTHATEVGCVPRARDADAGPWPDLAALAAARHPLILLGPALNDTRAPGLAQALQNRLQAPVLAMESPRGLNDPSLGRLTEVARRADHVLCIGKPPDFTLRFAAAEHWPNVARWDVVLGDVDLLAMARRNLGARLGVGQVGDPLAFARHLIHHAPAQPPRADWIASVAGLIVARLPGGDGTGILPVDICAAVQAVLDQTGPATLICDGGEFGQWAQAGTCAPKRVINGVSGMIGGGLGYAIGAKAADPDRTVIALMGDGTIGFHLAEFETAVRAGLAFVAVIGNDRRWNAEHLIQTNSFGADRLLGCDLSGARYDLAVEALGGFGAHVTRVDDLPAALTAAVQSGLPACVNVEMQGLGAPTF